MVQRPGRPVPVGSLCAGPGCWWRHQNGQSRRRVVPGLRLCQACRRNLGTRLKNLPELYDECGRLLAGSGQSRDRTSGGPMPGIPFNTTAADVRDAILGVLASWSGLVVKERQVTAPPRTVSALADFLGKHVDWLAAHVAATEFTDEVLRLARSARLVAYPSPIRRVPVGACVETGCTGELVALVHPQEQLLPPEISCNADSSHSWRAHQWMQLSRRIRAAPSVTTSTTRWLSARDISCLWFIPQGSVYRLASEQRWRRRSQAGRTHYHEADVTRTLYRREPRPRRRAY